MAEVFLCATGQLTATARRELRKAGVVVVEVDDPSACQFIRSTETVPAESMVWAAVDALRRNYGYGNNQANDTDHKHRERFVVNLFELIDASRADQRKAADNHG